MGASQWTFAIAGCEIRRTTWPVACAEGSFPLLLQWSLRGPPMMTCSASVVLVFHANPARSSLQHSNVQHIQCAFRRVDNCLEGRRPFSMISSIFIFGDKLDPQASRSKQNIQNSTQRTRTHSSCEQPSEQNICSGEHEPKQFCSLHTFCAISTQSDARALNTLLKTPCMMGSPHT